MTKCTFCGREYAFNRGVTLITNTGSLIHFCSSKCRKNSVKLGRVSHKQKWSKHKTVIAEEKEKAEKVV